MLRSLCIIYISLAEKFKAKTNTNILCFKTFILFMVYLSQKVCLYLILKLERARNAGMRVHDESTAPLHFVNWGNGDKMPLHNIIISNFMIYQDRLETYLLQLFAQI